MSKSWYETWYPNPWHTDEIIDQQSFRSRQNEINCQRSQTLSKVIDEKEVDVVTINGG